MSFLFTQLCSKRICYQLASLPTIQDLLSIDKTNQLAASFQMQMGSHNTSQQKLSASAVLGSSSDLAFHLKSKFQWQNVFDLMRLHTVFREKLAPGGLEDQGLCEEVNVSVERYLRSTDGPRRVLGMLRAYIAAKGTEV